MKEGPSESKENKENREKKGEKETNKGRGNTNRKGKGSSRNRQGEKSVVLHDLTSTSEPTACALASLDTILQHVNNVVFNVIHSTARRERH